MTATDVADRPTAGIADGEIMQMIAFGAPMAPLNPPADDTLTDESCVNYIPGGVVPQGQLFSITLQRAGHCKHWVLGSFEEIRDGDVDREVLMAALGVLP